MDDDDDDVSETKRMRRKEDEAVGVVRGRGDKRQHSGLNTTTNATESQEPPGKLRFLPYLPKICINSTLHSGAQNYALRLTHTTYNQNDISVISLVV